MLCYIISYYVLLCYFMLYYVIFVHTQLTTEVVEVKYDPLCPCWNSPGVNVADDVLDPRRVLWFLASQEPVSTAVMNPCGCWENVL